MKIPPRCIACVICCFLLSYNISGQVPPQKTASHSVGLFDSDSVMEITISGNLRDLLNDRGELPKLHPVILACKSSGQLFTNVAALAKTRGHFRKLKQNCLYPPLQIHFTKNDSLEQSVFKGLEKIKLVMPCQGDAFIVNEWLVYKLYNLLTPKSFRARLVKIRLADSRSKKTTAPFYAVFLEEEKQMAARNKMVSITGRLQPEQTEKNAFLIMSVFEYMIGNTDWSVQYMQNIKLLAEDTTAVPVTVPYDFDHAGIVNTPYAKPAEELLMSSVLERRYRGYCVRDMKQFDSTIALYNSLKNDLYAVYNNCTLLDDKLKRNTIQYLDAFYATINNPVKLRREFQYPCDKNGTGNVVIKGLKED